MNPTAVIVHLSGASRGRSHRLRTAEIRLGTAPDNDIVLRPPASLGTTSPSAWLVALTLERRGRSYELRAADGLDVWVNGEPVSRIVLASGDVIEVGRGGPVLRFRLYRPGSRAYKSMAEAFSDCVDCARYGADSTRERVDVLIRGTAREFATQISPFTRVALLLVAGGVLGSLGTLWFRQVRLERRLSAETGRFEAVAELIEQTGWASRSPADLEQARERLAARVEALEQRAGARERTIATASGSVIFLQSAFGFVDSGSGRPLRFVGLGPDGRPLTDDAGLPRITLDGNGPPVEVLVTGTAFVADEAGYLLTNRHVALPWEFDDAALAIAARGFRPTMNRFVGYLPAHDRPLPVVPIAASDAADVAVLHVTDPGVPLPPLRLNDEPPQIGDEVIVLGYPTGMRALIARAGQDVAEQILAQGPADFWDVARRLASGGHIAPLATVGVVGQVTAGSVVYDAETTHGGSGGPVLDLDGGVVAVNAAVLPEFAGSNLGVPARRARELLDSVRPDGTAAVAPE